MSQMSFEQVRHEIGLGRAAALYYGRYGHLPVLGELSSREWREICNSLPQGSEARKQTFAKLAATSQTFNDALFVHTDAPEGSAEKSRALADMETRAQTFTDWFQLLKVAGPGTPLHAICTERISGLASNFCERYRSLNFVTEPAVRATLIDAIVAEALATKNQEKLRIVFTLAANHPKKSAVIAEFKAASTLDSLIKIIRGYHGKLEEQIYDLALETIQERPWSFQEYAEQFKHPSLIPREIIALLLQKMKGQGKFQEWQKIFNVTSWTTAEKELILSEMERTAKTLQELNDLDRFLHPPTDAERKARVRGRMAELILE